jgi:hypothetical protein
METIRELSRKERTEAEIDSRLHNLELSFLNTEGEISTAQIFGYLRAAYAQGYSDCLKEPEGQLGQWILDLGYGKDLSCYRPTERI